MNTLEMEARKRLEATEDTSMSILLSAIPRRPARDVFSLLATMSVDMFTSDAPIALDSSAQLSP